MPTSYKKHTTTLAVTEKVPAAPWLQLEAPTQPTPERADMNLLDAFTAAKAAYDLATVAIQARDDVKIQSAMADLRERIWDMSGTGLAQVQALHSLELETQKLRMQLADAERSNADLEAKLEEESKYQIAEIRPGVWAYCLVEHANSPVEQRPNFCAVCYSGGKKVPLRYYAPLGARLESFKCLVDDSHTFRNKDAEYQARRALNYPRTGIV